MILSTLSYAPGLETLLLHGHSVGSLFPDVTQEAHRLATVSRGQSRRVAVFHVYAAAFITGLPRCPSDLLGLKRSKVGAPVHVANGTAVVSAVNPKIVQNPITCI
jgi:hypothetical protein